MPHARPCKVNPSDLDLARRTHRAWKICKQMLNLSRRNERPCASFQPDRRVTGVSDGNRDDEPIEAECRR